MNRRETDKLMQAIQTYTMLVNIGTPDVAQSLGAYIDPTTATVTIVTDHGQAEKRFETLCEAAIYATEAAREFNETTRLALLRNYLEARDVDLSGYYLAGFDD